MVLESGSHMGGQKGYWIPEWVGNISVMVCGVTGCNTWKSTKRETVDHQGEIQVGVGSSGRNCVGEGFIESQVAQMNQE